MVQLVKSHLSLRSKHFTYTGCTKTQWCNITEVSSPRIIRLLSSDQPQTGRHSLLGALVCCVVRVSVTNREYRSRRLRDHAVSYVISDDQYLAARIDSLFQITVFRVRGCASTSVLRVRWTCVQRVVLNRSDAEIRYKHVLFLSNTRTQCVFGIQLSFSFDNKLI